MKSELIWSLWEYKMLHFQACWNDFPLEVKLLFIIIFINCVSSLVFTLPIDYPLRSSGICSKKKWMMVVLKGIDSSKVSCALEGYKVQTS